MKRSCYPMIVVIALIVASACDQRPITISHRLSSGRVIKIISVNRVDDSERGKALAISYQTNGAINKPEDLRPEVADIWRDFQRYADRSKLPTAVIIANEPPNGGVMQAGKSFGFTYVRQADGSWREAR